MQQRARATASGLKPSSSRAAVQAHGAGRFAGGSAAPRSKARRNTRTAAHKAGARPGQAGRVKRAKGAGPALSSGRRAAAAKRGKRPAVLLRRRRVKRAAAMPRISSAAYQAGYRAGREDGLRVSLEHEPFRIKALNRHWMARTQAQQRGGLSWRQFNEASKGYVHGYFRARKQVPPPWVLLPTDKSVAAIVSVRNEEKTIGSVVRQLNRLPLDEVYVIVNGSTDRSFQQVRERSQACVLSFPEALGHDVGRAMGAKLAQADILLFLDGDIVIPAEALIPFIGAVDRGADLALNDIGPYLNPFAKQDQVTHMKQFLNASLGRHDLGANSLTAVPHALSRKAVETLGLPNLMVPPKAQALAVHRGLRITAPGSVNVIRGNKRRRENTGRNNQVADLIIGDHVEALKLAGDLAGERLAFVDALRQREQTGGEG